jgi:hypothetical protein
MVERAQINAGVTTLLDTNTPAGWLVEFARVPDGLPPIAELQDPYLVVDGEPGVELTYVVTSVGRTPQQSQLGADDARRILVARGNSADGFAHSLNVSGHRILDRRAESVGAPEASGQLWQTVDRYVLVVSAT